MGRVQDYSGEAGATMVEYGFLLAGIAVVVATALVMFGPVLNDLYVDAAAWF